ncbi:MAG TPA: hypothetical protein VG407_12915 [Caulobacteraceae bacterium]|jgi:hypothetical protein|nr:hypothetical protein [Caulobacteraceae bacterium]
MRRMGIAILGSLMLGGCSMAPLITPAAIEYNQVEEDVNNQILVTNILRARDGAPIYLAEFQNIHVSFTGTVGTGNVTVPFGRGKVPNAKSYSALPNASLVTAPSFDATQLDTQQFTLGMLKPVDPMNWEYYWHRNYSPQILLHLFLASISQGTNTYNNNPCVSSSAKASCDVYASFTGQVDKLADSGVYLNIFSTLTPTELKDPTKIPDGVKVVLIDGKSIAFQSSASQVAICTPPQGDPRQVADMFTRLTRYQVDPCPAAGGAKATPATGSSASQSLLSSGAGAQGPSASGSALSPDDMAMFACTHRQVVQCKRSWAELQESSVEGGGYVLRSVDGILRYLGRVQQVVDETPGPDNAMKGVTWTENGAKQTLFQLHREPGLDRIAVNYRGQRYYVRQGDPNDHTLEVLALVNQLINANKNASEIPSTKAVQILP